MADYSLGKRAHDEIFATAIRPQYFEKTTARLTPKAIVTGGQPGSGKSGLVAEARSLLSPEGGVVLIDADELRSYHPDYEALLSSNDKSAADLTHKEAAAWAEELRENAIAGRRNLIVDQTSRDPVAALAIAKTLNDAGYEVEFWCMAVSAETSMLRIHQRYERQKAETGQGRFSNAANHAAAFMGLPATIELLEQSSSVGRVRVLQKDHVEVYENSRTADGTWRRPPLAAKALKTERERPMTISERTEFIMDALWVLDKMEVRRAGAASKHEVQRLVEAVKDDLPIAEAGEIYRGTIVHIGKNELLMKTEEGKVIEHKRSMIESIGGLQVGAIATIDYRHWRIAKMKPALDKADDRAAPRKSR